MVAGVGVPQLTAIIDAVEARRNPDTPVIADGGIKYSGDLAKALAAGADVRDGRLAARRHRRDAGRGYLYQGRSYKSYRGMGSVGPWRAARPTAISSRTSQDTLKLVPEGIEGQVPYKGRSPRCCISWPAGCAPRWAMSAPRTMAEFHDKAEFIRISSRGPARKPRPRRDHHAREPELPEPGVSSSQIVRSVRRCPRGDAQASFQARLRRLALR
jgi:IMP dehydrogenase